MEAMDCFRVVVTVVGGTRWGRQGEETGEELRTVWTVFVMLCILSWEVYLGVPIF